VRLMAHPKIEKCSYDFLIFARATPPIQKGKEHFSVLAFCFAEMRRRMRGVGERRRELFSNCTKQQNLDKESRFC
jgi:hypothetical protein